MSAIHHFTGDPHEFNWENVEKKVYDDANGNVFGSRRVMINAEREGAQNFVFRYFHFLPGSTSHKFDQHLHDHGVLILHGHCTVVLNGQEYPAGPMDVIYISPNDVHHFVVQGDEPLGFLCVIPNLDRLTPKAG
jgi:quercetin dioxygenase-like cupin family protein